MFDEIRSLQNFVKSIGTRYIELNRSVCRLRIFYQNDKLTGDKLTCLAVIYGVNIQKRMKLSIQKSVLDLVFNCVL